MIEKELEVNYFSVCSNKLFWLNETLLWKSK